MAHRIARERGWVNVRAMMDQLTVAELMELNAFEMLEPSGQTQHPKWVWWLLSHLWQGKEPLKIGNFFPHLVPDDAADEE